jgi:hypothetical protein
MKLKLNVVFFLVLLPIICYAGAPEVGNIKYELKTNVPYHLYQLTDKDRAWVNSLVRRFDYKGRVFVFLKTNLPLSKGNSKLDNQVYSTKKHDKFYVIDGNAFIDVGEKVIFSPGTGGFTMFLARSKNFIVCMNYNVGIEFERKTLDIKNGDFLWYGDGYKRHGY